MAETLILSLSSCPAGSYSVSTIELNGPISQLRHFRAFKDMAFFLRKRLAIALLIAIDWPQLTDFSLLLEFANSVLYRSQLHLIDLRGVVVTAPGNTVDFVSRCFYPKLGVNEDPVTGSAYCELAPYWSARLGRKQMKARQLSKRGGTLNCSIEGDRVLLSGNAVDFMSVEIKIPEDPNKSLV